MGGAIEAGMLIEERNLAKIRNLLLLSWLKLNSLPFPRKTLVCFSQMFHLSHCWQLTLRNKITTKLDNEIVATGTENPQGQNNLTRYESSFSCYISCNC